jgi:hypothetical protein
MRPVPLTLVVCIVVQSLVAAQSGPTSPSASVHVLPVKRVILYKTGVGYFEHLGNVVDRQDVGITFTTAQLNDVLKSLTAIDLGKGHVASINYNSVAPLDHRIGSLRLPLNEAASVPQLLATLRGARIEVSGSGRTTQGRFLSIERQTRRVQETSQNVDTFSMVTDAGEIRTYDFGPTARIRVMQRDLRQEIGRYLDLVGSIREQDTRTLTISSVGTGERPLFVSYVSEVPIWKSTYRLVFPSKGGNPFLQGWAIVDNTTGVDWEGVELSLVAGAPQSFIQSISQPYYSRRPVVPMPTSMLPAPQTHQPTLRTGQGIGQGTGQGTAVAAPPPPPATMRESIAVSAETPASLAGQLGGIGGGRYSGPASTAYEQARQLATAAGGDLGDLFEYRVTEPVSLTKNQSALVPIVNAEVDAERVSLWNRASGSGRPLRAIWLTNASASTLDGGSITIVDGNAFAGEGLVTSFKPGERRLVSYGADLAVLVRARSEGAPVKIRRVRAVDGILIQDSQEVATWTYSARNEDGSPRTLVIEHPTRDGWKLVAAENPAEETPDTQRFRLNIPAKQEASFVVKDVKDGESRVAIAEINDTIIAKLVADGIPIDALQKAMAPIIEAQSVLAGFEQQLNDHRTRHEAVAQDQQRIRENMKALRGSAEEKQLLQRYARQLDQQENELAQFIDAATKIAKQRDQARAELVRRAAALTFELHALER